jgi:phenylalanine-4-hydroxylase
MALGLLPKLARLYWYTVEFGLIRTAAGLRIFGAGIMSSTTESVFALESPSPNRIGFELERVMRTKYLIDDFQQTYFVIDNFEKLLSDCYQDFAPFYQRIVTAPDIEAHVVLDGDCVLTRGTHAYFRKKHATTAAADPAR